MAVQEQEVRTVLTAQDKASAVFRSLGSEMKKAEAGMSGVQKAFAALAAAAPIAALTAKLVDSTRMATELGRLSQQTGIAAQQLQALKYAAAQVDVGWEDVQSGVSKFGVRVAQAAAGNTEFLATFKALGISQGELQANLGNTEGLLRKVADRFSTTADGANKSAIAVKLFEEGGLKLVPLLNQGSAGLDRASAALQRLGVQIGPEFVQNAQQFNRSMAELRTISEATSITIGATLLPGINKLLAELLEGQRIAGGFGSALLLLGTINPFRSLADNIKASRQEVDRLQAAQARALQQGRPGAAAGFTPAIEAEQKRLAFLYFQQRQSISVGDPSTFDARDLRRQQRGALGDAPTIPQGGSSGGEDKAKAFLSSLNNRLTALRESEFAVLRLEAAELKVSAAAGPRIAQLEALTFAQKKLTEAQGQHASDLQAEQSRRDSVFQSIAGYITSLHEEAAVAGLSNEEREKTIRLLALEQAGIDKNSNAYRAYAADLQSASDRAAAARVRADNMTPADKAAAEEARLTDLYKRGAIDFTEYRIALGRVNDGLSSQKDAVKEVDDAARELNMTFQSAFEDAIVGGKKLSDILKGLAQDVSRVFLRKTVTEPLGDALSKFVKGIDFGDLFNSNSSSSVNYENSFDLGEMMKFANGGSFTVGGSGGTDSQLVAFRATPGERVDVRTPGQQSGSGGGTTIINQFVDVSATVRQQIAQAMPSIVNATVAQVADLRRRGVQV